jgi:single-strand DNA-binding protein
MSVNRVILIGNVGRNPEIKTFDSGAKTATFTLATTERYKDKSGEDKEQTEWHNIVCWRGLADVVEKYVKTGTQLYIEGKIKSRSYSDKEGNTKYITEIMADSLQMLGKREKTEESGSRPQVTVTPPPVAESFEPQAGDLPF